MGKNLEFSDLITVYGDMLTDKQRDVLELYYDEDLSLAEIAENMSISRQGVRDSIKRGEETLLSLEKSLGLHRKQLKYNELIQTILSQVDEIRCDLKSISYSRNVRAKADALYDTIKTNEDILD